MDAGSDTTAIALTNVMYYLIKNPQSLIKLREEVSGAILENGVGTICQSQESTLPESISGRVAASITSRPEGTGKKDTIRRHVCPGGKNPG